MGKARGVDAESRKVCSNPNKYEHPLCRRLPPTKVFILGRQNPDDAPLLTLVLEFKRADNVSDIMTGSNSYRSELVHL